MSYPAELRKEKKNWRALVFYYNPEDPSVWVPKRTRLGWTVNFAHPVAWLWMAGLLLLIPVIAVLKEVWRH